MPSADDISAAFSDPSAMKQMMDQVMSNPEEYQQMVSKMMEEQPDLMANMQKMMTGMNMPNDIKKQLRGVRGRKQFKRPARKEPSDAISVVLLTQTRKLKTKRMSASNLEQEATVLLKTKVTDIIVPRLSVGSLEDAEVHLIHSAGLTGNRRATRLCATPIGGDVVLYVDDFDLKPSHIEEIENLLK